MNKLNILYEDNHIIVVEKPCNIPSQADKTGDEIAQVDRTLMRYMGRSGSGSTTGRGGGRGSSGFSSSIKEPAMLTAACLTHGPITASEEATSYVWNAR